MYKQIRQIEKQTNIQIYRQTERQIYIYTYIYIYIYIYIYRQTIVIQMKKDRQKNREIETCIDREIDRYIYR